MVIEKEEMLSKKVLYIGSAVPLETAEGLEGVQKPLSERYPLDNRNLKGILSTITIIKDGIILQYDSDPSRKLMFPISSLNLCAAVRCIPTVNTSTGEKTPRFVSLSNPAAGGDNINRPAIFTTITRRTEGRKILECHGFVCSADKDALDLVQCTAIVDKMYKTQNARESTTTTNVEKQTLKSTSASTSNVTTAEPAIAGPDGKHPVRLVVGDTAARVAPEFYEAPPQHGYFYKTPDSQIKTYTVERIMEGEAERLRAISAHAPVGVPRGPPSERRMVYATPPPSYMTLPHAQDRHLKPVRVIPAQPSMVRPRFFSPPPPVLRPQPVAMPPNHVVGADPYVFMPPVPMMEPQYVVVNRSSRRRRSHSSSRSSSPSSPPQSPKATNGQEAVNENGIDESTDASSRPHSPPTDYDEKGPRVSRKDQHEHHQRVLREMNANPVHYSTMPHPYGMYMMYPPHYLGYPPYMMPRPRSVPPPMNRGKWKNITKSGKSKREKKKKKSGKERMHGAPSDISTDSMGYTSEVGPGEYPRMPRDFRRFENQFKHERAFSKSLKEEGSKGGPQAQDSGNAYSLNERMSKRGDRESDFNLY